jgi:predicted O-methyltransferase YrrM
MSIKLDSFIISQSLDSLLKYIPFNSEYFNLPAGKEHYKLLANISMQMPDNAIIADIGTSQGLSALALSLNQKVKVISYDINDTSKYTYVMKEKGNIEFIIKDALLDIDRIKNSSIIMLDIDPHDGLQEKRFIELLENVNYKGIIICDDIHLNDGMRSWWSNIKQRKMDITVYGHFSGTGIIMFESL